MQLKPTRLNIEQFVKVLKVAGWLVLSAFVSALITTLTDRPDLFGPMVPVVNLVLVALKQVFTPAK